MSEKRRGKRGTFTGMGKIRTRRLNRGGGTVGQKDHGVRTPRGTNGGVIRATWGKETKSRFR